MAYFLMGTSLIVSLFMFIFLSIDNCTALQLPAAKYASQKTLNDCRRLKMAEGFDRTEIPKPKIITPSRGKKNSNLEKFLMMYTCKICDGRNAQMVI
jgi:hypothetical protein